MKRVSMIARTLACLLLLAIPTGRDVHARQPRPYFIDVTSRSQFSYVRGYGSRKYFIQPLAGGVAILDYDNDGRMDVFFTNGAELPSVALVKVPSRLLCSSVVEPALARKRSG